MAQILAHLVCDGDVAILKLYCRLLEARYGTGRVAGVEASSRSRAAKEAWLKGEGDGA